MILYLVRHGYAGERGDPRYPDDSKRPLTKGGRRRFEKTVEKLSERGFQPALIATSPFVRCRQTAEVIHERHSEAEIVELEGLTPGGDLAAVIEWTREQTVDAIAWVGHAPDLDEHAAALICSEGGSIRFAKGGIAALEFSGPPAVGAGELRWLITPKLLGC